MCSRIRTEIITLPRRGPMTRLLALLAAAGITAGFAVLIFRDAPEIESYATHLGGQRQVRLEDGSIITLNTDSSLNIQRDGPALSVQILRGEAYFNMVPNPHRRMIVSAGDQFTVRDIGTIFDVRLSDQGGGQVTVQKGQVQLSVPQVTGVQLHQNQQATVDSDSSHVKVYTRNLSPKEIERHLAWLQHHLDFDCTPVAEAAKEFNRYNPTPIEVMDEAAGKVQVGGVFLNTDPITFAEEIASLDANIRLSSIAGPAHTRILQLSTRNPKTPPVRGCTAK